MTPALLEMHDHPFPHHRLAGRAVREGDVLEVLLADGGTLRGRYRWSHIPGMPAELLVALAGQPHDSGPAGVAVQLPGHARCRWP